MDMGNPITRTSHRSSQGVFSHRCLRKASSADPVITGLGGSAGIAGTDRPSFRRLHLDAPHLLLLRELSRVEETLLEEFRRSANRLREQLHRFYPQMLQLCSAADEPWLWDLLHLAPTPAHAMLLSEEQVQHVLKVHRIRRLKAPAVLACLQTPALPVAPGTPEAVQAHCGFLLPCLRVLAEQLQACSQQVSALLRTMAGEPGEGKSPSDVAIVQSLPGVGRKIT